MGKRGPAPKTRALKAISGTDRPCRRQPEAGPLPDVPLVSEMPPPPGWINNHGVAEWNRLGTILVALGILAERDLGQFAMWMALHGKMVQMWAAGETPPASMYGQYRAYASDFGLTKRMTGEGSGPEKPKNPFAGNRGA